ncbi:hypothetical protein UT300012_22190 [Paraclostridium bifermentans]
MKNRIIVTNVATLAVVAGMHFVFWSKGFSEALGKMPIHYAYMSGWLTYELPQFLLLITVMLTPVAWTLVDNYDYLVVSRRGNNEDYIVEKCKGSIVVRENKRRKTKPYREEEIELSMKVMKRNVIVEALAEEDECDELELEHYVLLRSGTKVEGEYITLEIRNKDFYDAVMKEQVFKVNLTVQFDRRGRELDRRFEFII